MTTSSGSLKVVNAPDGYAGIAAPVVEAAIRSVLDEAIAAGERVPFGLEVYVPREAARRARDELLDVLRRCYRGGYERGRSERG